MPKVAKCKRKVGTFKSGKKVIFCGMPLVNGKCPEHGSKTSE